MENVNSFKYVNEDGKEIVCDILFTFDSDDKATMIGSERDDGMEEIEVDDPTKYQEAADKCKGECIEVYD